MIRVEKVNPMGLDREQLSVSFRAKGFIKNSKGEWTKVLPKSTGVIAELERNISNGTLGQEKIQEPTRPKFFVRVTSFRRRLLDEDNLCEKYHVDLCRYSGALPSDSAKEARIKVNQKKVKTQEEERVEIAIYEL